jgi:hypothetical protein
MILSGPRRATIAIAAAGLIVAASAGCSSSKSGSASSTPPPTPTGSTQSSTGGGAPPTIDAATTAAVKNAYVKFFDPKTPVATSVSLLQDGSAFQAALEAQAKGSLAQGASAEVSKVSLQSPNTAKVVFSILVNGKALLTDQPGYAVHDGGTWKVAAQTFCGLLTLQGAPPAACNTPAATTLPG